MKKLICAATAVLMAVSLSTAAFASGGAIFQATAGEDNTITVGKNGEDRVAISFKADSDPDKFYFGVSTDWDDCPYVDAFEDVDAYFYGFIINPSIPAATIPRLYIYNPFVDDDGEAAVDAGKITIYRITDKGITDVTENFTYGTDGDGDPVFATKTRKPGAYVLSEKKVDTSKYETKEVNKKVVRIAVDS